MRIRTSTFVATLVLAAFSFGCAGPEQKLGRGISNLMEPVRLGELGRTMEQTALWEGPNRAYSKGFLRGLNRTIARTAVGAFEIVTFPFGPYGPHYNNPNYLAPDHTVRVTRWPNGGLNLSPEPIYPESYTPGLVQDATFSTDTYMGFSGGDSFPFLPFSRFKVFDVH